MDDLVLIHEDKQYLMKCLSEIRGYAEKELKLDSTKRRRYSPSVKGWITSVGTFILPTPER